MEANNLIIALPILITGVIICFIALGFYIIKKKINKESINVYATITGFESGSRDLYYNNPAFIYDYVMVKFKIKDEEYLGAFKTNLPSNQEIREKKYPVGSSIRIKVPKRNIETSKINKDTPVYIDSCPVYILKESKENLPYTKSIIIFILGLVLTFIGLVLVL